MHGETPAEDQATGERRSLTTREMYRRETWRLVIGLALIYGTALAILLPLKSLGG